MVLHKEGYKELLPVTKDHIAYRNSPLEFLEQYKMVYRLHHLVALFYLIFLKDQNQLIL